MQVRPLSPQPNIMNITRKLESVHHIYEVSNLTNETLSDILVEVFKKKNELRSWPGLLPESRKKLRELEKQGALYNKGEKLSLDSVPKEELWIHIGKKPLFTIIRFVGSMV